MHLRYLITDLRTRKVRPITYTKVYKAGDVLVFYTVYIATKPALEGTSKDVGSSRITLVKDSSIQNRSINTFPVYLIQVDVTVLGNQVVAKFKGNNNSTFSFVLKVVFNN